jgi:hypothetical protein
VLEKEMAGEVAAIPWNGAFHVFSDDRSDRKARVALREKGRR